VVTFSDGKTLTVKNGSKGSQGTAGKDGADGAAGANGKDGADGGYYTPIVSQPDPTTMRVTLAGSKSGMPAIAPVNVALPAGVSATHKWDGTVLTITSASGASGANPKGDDGYTPIAGVDYYTEADKAEFMQYISTELAKRGQLKPEFANSIDECTDTSKLYVLPDNFIYAYMSTTVIVPGGTVPDFTNLLTVADAEIRRNVRYSKSANEFKSANGIDSIIIPIPTSGTITIRCKSCGRCTSYANCYGSTNKTTFQTDIIGGIDGWAYDPVDTSIVYFTFTNSTGLKYLVFMSDTVNTSTDIVTANEEITYTTTEDTTETTEAWTNTGHAFVPADYEDRIVELETGAKDVLSRVIALERAEPASVKMSTVYAPSPQLPADGSETADFNATPGNINTQMI
jgi:hypothetical protein